jgi:ABC-type Fe3+ transport system permease subunit
MAHQGQAADYYNGGGAPVQQPQDAYYQGQPKYPQQPPQYGQNYAPPQGAPPQHQNGYQQDGYGADSKTFDQQFKIEKPKYHDWWAGLLFIAVFLGYVAVSAITIRGYSNQHSGGIYGNANQFALNSNTIILFAFVLGMATILSYAYIWVARAFTKQFIWITGILSKCASAVGVGWSIAHSFRSWKRPGKLYVLLQA